MRASTLLGQIVVAVAETLQARKLEQLEKRATAKDSFLDNIKKEYDAEFRRCYPQVPVHTRWGKGRDNTTVFRVLIRGEQQPNMTSDEVISAIARFKRKGRPRDKWGRMMPE